MKNKKYISLKDSYELCLEIAGEKKDAYKRTIRLYILTFLTQGIAFGLFYPFINAVLEKNYENSLFWFFIILILSIISIVGKWFAHNFDYTSEASNIHHELRLRLGKKLRSMPLEKLYTYRTGELNSIFSSGVDESVIMMGFISGMILEAIILPLLIVGFAFLISIKLALILLFAFLLFVPLYSMQRKLAIKDRSEQRVANATLESEAIEYIQGIGVLKSLNLIGQNAKKLYKSIKNVKTAQKQGVFRITLIMSAVSSLIEFSIFLILVVWLYFIAKDELPIAGLIVLIVWIVRVAEPMANFLAITGIADLMNVAFKSIKNLLSIKNLNVQDATVPQDFNISFNDVYFSYLDSSELAIKNLSFEIPANSFTAIIGDSGSGKTTITKLLMRYSDPKRGSIKIGGIDIRNIATEDLMKNISVVFQDVYLFDDTILNNIKMAKNNASDDEVLEAARAAYCHEFIERLPNGYDTIVGEIGGSLSGGEKQRISIARAILKNSPIVILDEPTSALDTQSEVAVQKALNALTKDKTIIIIAHRLSTIVGADKILVIENGALKESGSHEELIKKESKYKRMFEAQARVKKWHIK